MFTVIMAPFDSRPPVAATNLYFKYYRIVRTIAQESKMPADSLFGRYKMALLSRNTKYRGVALLKYV